MTAIETIMAKYAEGEFEPKLGIFWYDKNRGELFGITKQEASDVPFAGSHDKKTVRSLHKTWWQRQKQLVLAGKQKNKIYLTDYTQVPRGRIFQDREGTFYLYCGSWITDDIVLLVKNEFMLEDVPFKVVIDEHWELGNGWSE